MWAADLGDLDARRAGRARGVGRVRRPRRAREQRRDPEAHARHRPHARRRRSTSWTSTSTPPMRMALAVLPRMLERGHGQIMFVSSMGGRIPIANESAYNAAKYAMCGFAEAMLLDLAGTGVDVKLVLPGPDRHRDLGPARQRARADRRRQGAARGMRGRHRRRDRGRRLRVLRAARVPRRHRRQGDRGRQDRSTATSTCAAWPTGPRRLRDPA